MILYPKLLNPRATGANLTDSMNISEPLKSLETTTNWQVSEQAIVHIAECLKLPTIAWAADISSPVIDPVVDQFMRRRGWSDQVMALWWSRSVMLKAPLYIRCRFTARPFATEIRGPLKAYTPNLRRIETAMRSMGLTSMITIPVHRPRGRISMLTFCGDLPIDVARDVVGRKGGELMLAGQLFCQAHDQHVPPPPITEDVLSGLTPREWECMRLTALGHREAEVAALLNIEKSTVRYHLQNVVEKMGATSRIHAVALASQLGMIGVIST